MRLRRVNEEAKRRARRRRQRVMVIAVAVSVTVAGVAIAAMSGGERGSSSAASGAEAGGTIGAPGVEAVEPIAAWGVVHDGWVRIYADGRVLWENDTGRILERRLTRTGMALVRSGVLTGADIDDGRHDALASGIWAEAEFRPFSPSVYAVCFWVQLEETGRHIPATAVVDELPRAAQALVRGTERHFEARWGHFPSQREPGAECFRLSPATVDAFQASLDSDDRRSWDVEGDLPAPEPRIFPEVSPVMPDGTLMYWGG